MEEIFNSYFLQKIEHKKAYIPIRIIKDHLKEFVPDVDCSLLLVTTAANSPFRIFCDKDPITDTSTMLENHHINLQVNSNAGG